MSIDTFVGYITVDDLRQILIEWEKEAKQRLEYLGFDLSKTKYEILLETEKGNDNYYSLSNRVLNVILIRPETSEEAKIRKARTSAANKKATAVAKALEEAQKTQEYKDYLRLKEKFENE